MASSPAPQRAWRALCPNCGAPVEFRSAASASAVCGFCRSTLLRDGEALRRIGTGGELFEDHSPLRLGASGRYQGAGFMLVGRMQYAGESGGWNEWHALFDSGRSGWLCEDNGSHVFAFDMPAPAGLPPPARLAAGQRRTLDGRSWSVASVVQATLRAAEGELPRPPRAGERFAVAELRGPDGEVATIDYGDPQKPSWSVGRAVRLEELGMQGLAAEAAARELGARGIECPGCGASLEVSLASTRTIACRHCAAVVDLSKGVGADLAHYAQARGGGDAPEPLLPLGSTGLLALGTRAPLPWQVVGYLERCEPSVESGEEQSFWREYLLYNRKEGFAFLVEAEDGWSWVRPLTGAPEGRDPRVSYQGVDYRRRCSYGARTTYVLGEFYWKVERGQRGFNTDYAGVGREHARKRLNREQRGGEVVWSGGETLDSATVARAFRLDPSKLAAFSRDVAPHGAFRSMPGGHLSWALLLASVLVIGMVAWARADRPDCGPLELEARRAGSAYRHCVANGHGSACEPQRLQLGEASVAHQRCLDAQSRSGGGSGGSWNSGGSWGGHK
ncbi:DUF4178 domain-containing protein [Caldimonas tepidiphila]|uniref:DUF4178 domain-containing protein n=1 Tax=Caldimonas tepidiphila TaxID=2315841 RepID=UPI000E5BAF81|nr:DUF4178 domain-containing protein [Caldimonas tepidiphila]